MTAEVTNQPGDGVVEGATVEGTTINGVAQPAPTKAVFRNPVIPPPRGFAAPSGPVKPPVTKEE